MSATDITEPAIRITFEVSEKDARNMLRAKVDENGGSYSKASKALGFEPNALQRMRTGTRPLTKRALAMLGLQRRVIIQRIPSDRTPE